MVGQSVPEVILNANIFHELKSDPLPKCCCLENGLIDICKTVISICYLIMYADSFISLLLIYAILGRHPLHLSPRDV